MNARLVRRERGLTVVELLVAVLVGSILIWFVLSVYARMSAAYRSSSTVSETQQTLLAARDQIIPELRQAGYGVTPAFATVAGTFAPVSVVNAADPSGTDVLRFYAADASRVARVVVFDDASRRYATVDDPGDFLAGDVVVLSNPELVDSPAGPGAAEIVRYQACVVKITRISGADVWFEPSEPDWNEADNAHCAAVQARTVDEAAASETLMFGFTARSYRIDPARKELAVLQMSPSGELLPDDWEDLGLGFVDLQVATRYFEQDDPDDLDGDGDPERDWYSGDNQESIADTATLIEVGLGLISRTDHDMQGVATAEVPGLVDPAFPSNNRFGDRPAAQLAGIADSARAPEHRGNHIYRSSSSTVDIRNMGVGR